MPSKTTGDSSIKNLPLLLALLTCCLIPFLNKAFHIDDPSFLGMAKHIQSNPFDYYGYYMQFSPPVITNPPLIAYLIAIPGSIFGYGEFAIHSFFILPALAVIAGTWLLASDISADPFIAALATVCTPVFILSSTTVMCDVPMLAFWIFAIYFWRRGIREKRRHFLIVSSLMIILCVMTKYMGICLVPLLAAYTLAETKRVGNWLIYLMLPVVVLLLFDQMTYIKYGLRQISFIESWSSYNQTRESRNYLAKTVAGLSFLGGCILAHLVYFISRARRFHLAIYIAAIAAALLLLLMNDTLDSFPVAGADGINWLFVVQLFIFVFAGVSFFYMALSDLVSSFKPDAILLFLWISGVFAFAVFINWTINGRTILAVAPAAGIIIARFHKLDMKSNSWSKGVLYVSLLFSLIISLLVTSADVSFANSARTAAKIVHENTVKCSGNKWYEGHWGFEHYIKEAGDYSMLDYEMPNLKKGDTVIIPSNNTNTKLLFKHLALVREVYSFDVSKTFSTMSLSKGAGFYADVAGPLPYTLGSVPENYYEYEVIADKNSRFSY